MTQRAPVAPLVRAARGGDARAFGELVERYQAMARGYGLSMLRDPGLAEDACQDAFLDAFLHLDQLRDDAAFPSWLRRIVHKHSDRQRRTRLLAVELQDLAGAKDPLAVLIEAEERRAVLQEVSGLSPLLRTSIHLFYGAGLSVGEIAAFLNVSQGAVRKRLFDGRVQLRRRLPVDDVADAGPRDAVTMLIATRIGDARLVSELLARRPDLRLLSERWDDPEEARDYGAISCGYTLVQRAVFMGHREVVEVLVRAGAPLRGGSGLDPLDLAVLHNEVEIAKVLVAAGVPINGTREGTLTPLHRAAMRGHLSMAALLLEAGARPDALGPGNLTPLDWASRKGSHEIANLMKEYKQ